jgi:hypothetical protein
MINTPSNLAQFKALVTSIAGNTGYNVASKVISNKGELIKDNPPVMVGHAQTNAFAMQRTQLSWLDYGSAKHWFFEPIDNNSFKAIKSIAPNVPNAYKIELIFSAVC